MSNDTSYTFAEPIRAPYLNVINPRQFKNKGDPKFDATFIFPKTSAEVPLIRAQIAAAAKAKWPSRALTELKFPMELGDKKIEKAIAKEADAAAKEGRAPKVRDLSFFKDHYVLVARSKYAPTLSVLDNGRIITLESDTLKAQYKSKFYNGCFVGAVVNFVPYISDMGADGVTAYLQSLVWLKDGERIGGRDQAEVFKHYAGRVTNEDPGGLDDEIPF